MKLDGEVMDRGISSHLGTGFLTLLGHQSDPFPVGGAAYV